MTFNDRVFQPRRTCFRCKLLVASVSGLPSMEVTATLKRLPSHLATQWRKPYYQTCGYVKSRFAITLMQSTHRCIQGSRVLVHNIRVHCLQWEDGAGINLFRQASQDIPRPGKSLTPPHPLIYPSADGLICHKDLQKTNINHLDALT